MHSIWRLSLMASLLCLGACVGESSAVNEYLDPRTAMTISATATPFIYAHDVPELAANVRDYLSVGAVETNNMGARRHYLAVVSWTTIDRGRAGLPPPAGVEALELELDGKTRTLQPQSHEPRSIGSGEPLFRPPSGYLSETWYEVKPSDLRAFAAAPPAMLRVLRDDGATDYAAWKRADDALKAFVEGIPDAAPRNRPRR